MRPPLRFELKLLIITGYEHFSEFGVSDVADEFYTFDLLYLLVIADGNSKQQLVVLTAVQGTGGDVHVQFLCHHSRLIVDGNLFLEHTTAYMTLLTDVHQFAAETIGNMYPT